MRFVKPIDEALILELAEQHDLLVTIEENAVMGGAGSAVAECLAAHGIAQQLLQIGIPDRYIEHAKPNQMLADCGISEQGIESAIKERLALLLKQGINKSAG